MEEMTSFLSGVEFTETVKIKVKFFYSKNPTTELTGM